MKHLNTWFLFTAALLGILLSACAGGGVTPAALPTDTTLPDPTNTPVPEPPALDKDIVNILWQWERFDGGDGSVLTVDDPSRYTLTLNPDGTYQVKADCNMSGGAYTLEGSSLTLEPGPTTLAECESGSLYDEFLQKLGSARTYVVDGDNLVLNLYADAGNMVFAPGDERVQSDITLDANMLKNLEYRTEWTTSKTASG